jgi:tetratricopeptide (TPR) repeat protein
MTELFETVRELKTKAKNRRDLGRYQKGIEILDKAISLLHEELSATETLEWRSKIASELADCYGLTGGIYRRWALESASEKKRDERLIESIKAYDKGYDFESNEEYGIDDSYNLLNRLLSRIMYEPSWLTDSAAASIPDGVESLSLTKKLTEAEQVIQEQLKINRRGDIWAMADLALVKLLLDKADPRSAYADFTSESPPGYAYESVLSTLRPLGELNLPSAVKLRDAIRQLEVYAV